MKYIELFAGVGGFRLGIERAFYANGGQERGVQANTKTLATAGTGLQPSEGQDTNTSNRWAGERSTDGADQRPLCVFANEWDKYAAQTYNKNFGGEIDTRDITTISTDEIPNHDLLVGGFPCQAFSVAGKRAGFNDTRGTMFFEIARILADKKPQHLLLENVKGLLSHDSGRTFQTILKVLTDLGYRVEWQVLNSKDFGVPQNRERVFIVGHLGGDGRRQVFPISRGGGEANSKRTEKPQIYLGQAQRVRSTNGLSQTLAGLGGGQGAKTGLYAFGTRIRRLTPVECERLQGFPDGWTEGVSDTQRYKQMGNAVTVNVIEAIIERIYS